MSPTPSVAENQKSPALTLRFMASPTDVTMAGATGISGGRVLEWIDKAAYACAVQWSGQYCVTAYVGHIHFTRPIPSGHIVEVRSRIAMTGRSSMHIVNEVFSADPREGIFTRASDCLVIFVAMDENGKSTPVPKWVPQTEEEERVEKAAPEDQDKTGNGAAAFPGEVVSEMRKVVWPTGQQMLNYTLIVFGFLIVLTALVWGVDQGAAWVVEQVLVP